MSLDLKSNVHQINLKLVKPSITGTYEFEDFRLDAAHLMLYRGDKEISLPPKQVESLLALVEHHGEIVHKDVLMTRLWGNTAVEESNLIQNIYVLRKVLGQTADGRPMIETLRRRGYRFNGKLKEDQKTKLFGKTLSEAAVPVTLIRDTPEDKTTAAIHTFRSGRTVLACCMAALLVTAAFAGYFLYTPSTSALNSKAFAVLPVNPIEPANRNDLYEIGIADALIQGLSSVNGFVVRPLSATRKYSEIVQDPVAAGREQRVDYVLVSSYQIADGRIKVTSQLLDVATARIEETYQIEDDLKSVFAIQESFAASIRGKLMARFGRNADRPAGKSGTTNAEAYKYYQEGMVFNDRRLARNAIEYLEKAVSLDPGFARAWAGKAHAHLTAAGTDKDTNILDEYQRSREAIDKALALDPDLSEAHSALCGYKFFYEYQFAGAESECKRAVELDANSGIAHATYGAFLSSRGRHDEALREMDLSLNLEPMSYFYKRNSANELYWTRRYDDAIGENKQILAISDTDGSRYHFIICALEMQGKDAEAFEWFTKLLAAQKRGGDTIQRYKAIYETSGWRGVLLERLNDPKDSGHFRLATIYAALNNKDKAFEELDKAYEQRFWRIAYLQIEPMLDPLRDDPRYLQLVKRVEGH